MNVIIVGDGKVGMTLTKRLLGDGHSVTVIDTNQDVLDISTERFDVMTIQGNGASMDILQQADVKSADLLVAVSGLDEINLLACMTAHGINPKIHTIARIRNPEYSNQIYEHKDLFNISMTVNPERQAAIEIDRLLKYPGFLKRDSFAKGRVELVELKVEEGSKLCDITLNDMENVVKCRVLVCTVGRNGNVFMPGGDFKIKAGDRLYVTAPMNDLTSLLRNLGMLKHKAKHVLLCGGGRVSFYLAQLLEKSGVNVQLVEQNHDRCIELANALQNVNVIHGDASSFFLLDQEGINDCDALVTMTGLDEMNMIISIYGKKCEVPQIITKVDHTENSMIQDSLPLGSVVCPKDICCNNIVRYVRSMQNKQGAALTIYTIADGKAEASEFLVDENTLHCGEPLKNIKIRKNVLIACIMHGSRIEIPSGDSTFEEDNHLIVVSSEGEPIRNINDIFEE